MIDIHCHILPAVDDGPEEIDTSLRMAGIAAEDGITCIVATPHFSYNKAPLIEDIRSAVASLDARLKEEGIPLELVVGADIRMTYELIGGMDNRDMPTINGSRYFLLELPNVIPPHLDRFLFSAAVKGLVPIITHPERNHGLRTHPERLAPLREAGARFQLTAMSITGEFDNELQRFSLMMLRKGLVDFVASDAHDHVWRRPVLSRAYREVLSSSGETEARRIFFENPSAVLQNSALR